MREGWKYQRLGNICKTAAGGTPLKSRKEFYENGDIPWLRSGEVNNRNIVDCDIKITEEGLRNSSAKLFPPRTVLIAMYGATAGQVGILNFECSTNQAVCGILPNDKFVPEFLYYKFLEGQAELIKQAVGGAQPNISQEKIKNTFVPDIPLPEQKQIVSILDKAFAAIDQAKANIERNIENAKELLENVISEVLDSSNNNYPLVTFDKVVKLTRGHNPPKRDFIYEPKEGYVRFYQIRDGWSDDYKVYVPDTPKLHRVNKNEILMVAYRHIGKAFRNVEGAFNVALCKITNRDNSKLDNDYLFELIPSRFIKGELLKISERSLIPSMSVKELQKLKVPFPPIDDQKRTVKLIHAFRSDVSKIICAYERKLAHLETLRRSLLQKSFNGELTKHEVTI